MTTQITANSASRAAALKAWETIRAKKRGPKHGLKIYRRHSKECKVKTDLDCNCILWVYGHLHGKPIRQTLETRDLTTGQNRVKLMLGGQPDQTADIIEMSKQGYFTILLDEDLRVLEAALEDEGFKVIVLSDEDLKKLKAKARGWAILTRNAKDFTNDAVRFDYDVIAVGSIRYIDDKQDRTNTTVQTISGAIRRSKLATLKGNFLLTIRDDGSFHLEQLV